MNCPFCNTPTSEHPVNDCSNAWVAKLMGIDIITDFFPSGVPWYKYRKPKSITLSVVEPLTTSLDVFMSEVISEIRRRKYTYSYDGRRFTVLDNGQPVAFGESELDDMGEAGFRAAVKVLSE